MTTNCKTTPCGQADEHYHHEQQETLLHSQLHQQQPHDIRDEEDRKDHNSTSSLQRLGRNVSSFFTVSVASLSSILVRNQNSTSLGSIHTTNQNNVHRRLWLVLLVAALLMVEFTIQKRYYQYQQHPGQQLQKDIDGLASIVVPKSDGFLSSLELETCKFPIFFDKSRYDWKLQDNAYVSIGNWRERNQQYVGLEDAHNVYAEIQAVQRQRYNARQKARERGESVSAIRLTRRNITFVHIGKAGGSSVACNLRAGRKYIKKHCDNIDYDAMEAEAHYDPAQHNGQPYIPESAISRHVNCYTHWRMHLKCFYLQGDHPFSNLNMTNADRNFGSRALLSSSSSSSSSSTSSESERSSHHHHDHHHHSSSRSYDHHHHSSTSRAETVVEPYRGVGYSTIEEQQEIPRHHQSEPYPGNDFLLNLRSPVDRIASWFVYEHAENHEYGAYVTYILCTAMVNTAFVSML